MTSMQTWQLREASINAHNLTSELAALQLQRPQPVCVSGLWELWKSNLVDPASSHMLVSKIKPCMSQYELLHGEAAKGSLKQLQSI